MQSDQKVPGGCTHPNVSNDDLQLAAAMERSGPLVLLYFVIFSVESKHMCYLEPGKFGMGDFHRVRSSWREPAMVGGSGTSRPLLASPTSLRDGCSLPQEKHGSTEPTPACVSPAPSQESRVLAHLELSINQAPGSSSEAEQMFR